VLIEQPDLPPIHVWTNKAGETWACAAADHGPMCRLCRRVGDTLGALLENVRDGNMTARVDAKGEFQFKTTAKGDATKRKIEELKELGLLEVHPDDVDKPWGDQRLRRTAKGELIALEMRGQGDERN
jgi:hypothetical protein